MYTYYILLSSGDYSLGKIGDGTCWDFRSKGFMNLHARTKWEKVQEDRTSPQRQAHKDQMNYNKNNICNNR